MSDYFGALMRASGMVATGSSPVARRPLSDTGPVPYLEEDSETQQPAAPLAGQPPAAPRPHAAPAHPEDGPVPAERAAQRPAPQPGAAVEPPRTRPASQPQPEAAPRAHAPAPSVVPPAPAPVHPLARAAMDWVARDHQEPSQKQTPPPPAAAPAPAPAQPRVQAVPAAPPDAQFRQNPIEAQAQAGGSPAGAAPPRAERVEVSIGAIHLRVEAPAARTVASAAAPAPATDAVPSPSTARSSLARRSLRRI